MDQYEIVFKGEVMPQLEVAQVAEAMAGLFKTEQVKIDALFNGQSHTLKTGLQRADAEKYREALKRAGAVVYLRRLGVPARTAANASRAGSGLSVAPMLGNLVRDEERRPVVPVVIDTSGIDLAANDDSPLQPPAPPAPAAPDTDHLSLAEVGAELNPDRAPAPDSAPIETDAITLAPPDIERLVEPAAQVDQPLPDTSALQIEPAGEILKPHERPAPPQAPALQHDFDLCEPD